MAAQNDKRDEFHYSLHDEAICNAVEIDYFSSFDRFCELVVVGKSHLLCQSGRLKTNLVRSILDPHLDLVDLGHLAHCRKDGTGSALRDRGRDLLYLEISWDREYIKCLVAPWDSLHRGSVFFRA